MATRTFDPKALLEQTQKEVANSVTIREIDSALAAINDGCKTLAKLMTHLLNVDFENKDHCLSCGRKGVSVSDAGKTVAYIAKVVNEMTRLVEFHKGNADSRVQVEGGKLSDLLSILKPDQFQQVMTWMDENEQESVH